MAGLDPGSVAVWGIASVAVLTAIGYDRHLDKMWPFGGYGYTTEVHAMKVRPWTLRLKAATTQLSKAVRRGDRRQIGAALQDVWFWIGRLMGDALPAAAGPDRAAIPKAIAAMQAAQAVSNRAMAVLGGTQ